MGHGKHSIGEAKKRRRAFHLADLKLLYSYLTSWNHVSDVVVEAKINHVENSMTSQGCRKSFVEAPEPQAFLLNDLSCISKSRWLLCEREAKQDTSSLGPWSTANYHTNIVSCQNCKEVFPQT